MHFRRLAVTTTAEKAVLGAIERLAEIKAEEEGGSPSKTPHSHNSATNGTPHGHRVSISHKHFGSGSGTGLLTPVDGGANGVRCVSLPIVCCFWEYPQTPPEPWPWPYDVLSSHA